MALWTVAANLIFREEHEGLEATLEVCLGHGGRIVLWVVRWLRSRGGLMLMGYGVILWLGVDSG